VQIHISPQTDNHTSTSLSFYRPDALPPTQPTASKNLRQIKALKAVPFSLSKIKTKMICFSKAISKVES